MIFCKNTKKVGTARYRPFYVSTNGHRALKQISLKCLHSVALLITGMLIGKNGIDLIGHVAPILAFLGSNAARIESHAMTLINSLGSLGLLFLMMLAGMEADFKLFKGNRKPVILLSVLTFLLPAEQRVLFAALLGIVLGVLLAVATKK